MAGLREARRRRAEGVPALTYTLRTVGPDDAHQLGTAHVAIWKATYPGIVNQAKLDALTPRDRIARWVRIIEAIGDQEARGIHTRCAVDDSSGHIIGFATGGTPRDDDAPRPTELWSLNVIPDHHGSGIAARLMNEVTGHRIGAMFLWVATRNARAIAFYRKHGLELDGGTRFDPDWECHESRMIG